MYTKSWKRAYNVRKKAGLSLNASKTKHANDHATYANM